MAGTTPIPIVSDRFSLLTPAEKLTWIGPPSVAEGSRQRRHQPVEDAGGQHVERRPRQIHRVVGHEALVVADHQRVGQLDPEPAAVDPGEVLQTDDQIQGLVELEVGRKSFRAQLHLVVTEVAVNDFVDALESEQGRVELDDHIDLVAGHEVAGDLVDLLGRASVEGRKGDGVGDPRMRNR